MSAAAEALRRAVPMLRCPLCAEPVEPVETSPAAAAGPFSGVRCRSGHTFDRARQGYLTLFGPRGRRFSGDTTDQVLARDRVLRSGLFDPVAAMLARIACECVARSDRPGGDARPVVVEAGAGTGFYLGRVLEGLRAAGSPVEAGRPGTTADATVDAEVDGEVGPDAAEPLGIGTEISVAAARRLARVDPDAAALVADTWDGLPLADGSVDLVQVVFAPRNAAEFARVLRPGGTLVVAGPAPGHLEPLRTDAGMLIPETGKADRLESGLAGFFSPERVHEVDATVQVPAELAVDLALMGPSGVHLDRDDVERALGGLDRPVRVRVEARTFRRVE